MEGISTAEHSRRGRTRSRSTTSRATTTSSSRETRSTASPLLPDPSRPDGSRDLGRQLHPRDRGLCLRASPAGHGGELRGDQLDGRATASAATGAATPSAAAAASASATRASGRDMRRAEGGRPEAWHERERGSQVGLPLWKVRRARSRRVGLVITQRPQARTALRRGGRVNSRWAAGSRTESHEPKAGARSAGTGFCCRALQDPGTPERSGGSVCDPVRSIEKPLRKL